MKSPIGLNLNKSIFEQFSGIRLEFFSGELLEKFQNEVELLDLKRSNH